MKTTLFIICLCFISTIVFYHPTVSFSQEAEIVEDTVPEIISAIEGEFGEQGAQELAEFGGKEAVTATLEKVEAEGGEAAVARASYYAKTYGVSALEVIGKSPATYIKVLDELEPVLVKPALEAVEHDPEVVTELVTKYGKGALELAAKDPGVGTEIAEKLGEDGIQTAKNLSTNDAIRLARYSDDIANLPVGQKKEVLEAIAKAPARIFNYMEEHPKLLKTAAGVGVILAIKNNVLGRPGKPGFIERIYGQTISSFHFYFAIIFIILAVFISTWCSIRLWHTLRMAKYKQSVRSAKSEAQIDRISSASERSHNSK